jgi:hypothetical protein
MAKRGPKPKQINWRQFDKMCEVQCTLIEIAAMFECSPDTIERACERDRGMKFADYYAQKSQGGKRSLRRKQYGTAMKGNVTMMIWLGKQWLEQTDRKDITSNGETIKGYADVDDGDEATASDAPSD